MRAITAHGWVFFENVFFLNRNKGFCVFDASPQSKVGPNRLLTHRHGGWSGGFILLSPFQDLAALAAQQEVLEAHKPRNPLNELKESKKRVLKTSGGHFQASLSPVHPSQTSWLRSIIDAFVLRYLSKSTLQRGG